MIAHSAELADELTVGSHTYDAAGNLACRAATSATTCAGTTPTGAMLGYDNQGQLATWQNAPGGSLTSATKYLYDGEGNRVQQVATSSGVTTTTSYIGSLEEVTTSGGTTTTTAYYGKIALSVNGALSYTLSDGLGSVSESVNASGSSVGQVSATQLYGPYGSVRYQSGTLPTSKGFTGQRSDASTSGLDYYNARSYDLVAGQFTSADTTLASGLNRYGYVGGNPGTFTDPDGHFPDRSKDWRDPWWVVKQVMDVVLGSMIGAAVMGEPAQQPGYNEAQPSQPIANWEVNYSGNQPNGTQGEEYDGESPTPPQTTTGLVPDLPTAPSPGTTRWVGTNLDGSPGVFSNPPEGSPNVYSPGNGNQSHPSGAGNTRNDPGGDGKATSPSVSATDWVVADRHIHLTFDRIGEAHALHGNESWMDMNTTSLPNWAHTGSHGFAVAFTPWSLTAIAVLGTVFAAAVGIGGSVPYGTQGAYAGAWNVAR